MEFNETWQEARSQRPLPSLCFSGRSEKTRWPPWPLIGWGIFDFPETAIQNSTKLGRKQDLSVFYQVERELKWQMINRCRHYESMEVNSSPDLAHDEVAVFKITTLTANFIYSSQFPDHRRKFLSFGFHFSRDWLYVNLTGRFGRLLFHFTTHHAHMHINILDLAGRASLPVCQFASLLETIRIFSQMSQKLVLEILFMLWLLQDFRENTNGCHGN